MALYKGAVRRSTVRVGTEMRLNFPSIEINIGFRIRKCTWGTYLDVSSLEYLHSAVALRSRAALALQASVAAASRPLALALVVAASRPRAPRSARVVGRAQVIARIP